MSAQAGYEEIIAVTSIQGIVNRYAPTLFVWLESADSLWFSLMSSNTTTTNSSSSPLAWLQNTTVVNITGGSQSGVENLVRTFFQQNHYLSGGAALWDPNVWSTSLVAETAAGVDNLVPLSYRPADPTSLYSRLCTSSSSSSSSSPLLPTIQLNLTSMFNGNITGSIKRDVYNWAVDTFITSGKVDATTLGYFVDSFWITKNDVPGGWEKNTAPNHDFVIAKQGFFFDLSVWADEAPVDDPKQPLGSDLAAFTYMLNAAATQTGNKTLRIVGFTPWAYKYVSPNGKHQGVETEWATVVITSSFNAIVDSDACCIGNMASASFYQHFPLPDRFVQPPPPSLAQLQERGLVQSNGSIVEGNLYYMFYAGDFDSAAWLYSQLYSRWEGDTHRGTVPIGWPIDPILASRFPVIWPLLFSTLTPYVDVLISGDSGIGYFNPTQLGGSARAAYSALPDGTAQYLEVSSSLYRKFGITFTGFAITGDAPQMNSTSETAVYGATSRDGLVDQGWPSLVSHLAGPLGNMPVTVQSDVPASSPQDAGEAIAGYMLTSSTANATTTTRFHMFRSVLTSPTFLQQTAAIAANLTANKTVVVSPYELSLLMKLALAGNNTNMVSYIADTLPVVFNTSSGSRSTSGNILSFTSTVRNDGWNTLAASSHVLNVSIVSAVQVVHMLGGKNIHNHNQQKSNYGKLEEDIRTGGASQSRLRTTLANMGYMGLKVDVAAAVTPSSSTVSSSSSWQTFPFPSDLNIGTTLVIPATVTFPTTSTTTPISSSSPQVEGTLYTIQYQVVATSSSSDGDIPFDTYSNIPWQSDVLVV